MHWTHDHHLAYRTNVHPAESWADTFKVLQTEVLAVRDRLLDAKKCSGLFAIGLRLSARATEELLEGGQLAAFAEWLAGIKLMSSPLMVFLTETSTARE